MIKGVRSATFLSVFLILVANTSALAQNQTFELFIDSDTPTSGCDVTLAAIGTTLEGVDHQLSVQVDTNSLMVTDVATATCTGASFGALTSIDGGYPVGLNNGVSGGDVVEFAATLAELGISPTFQSLRFYLVAENTATGQQDLLASRDGGPDGGPIGFFRDIPIPLLSSGTLALLVAMLLITGLVSARRRPAARLLGLTLISGLVIASNHMADGNVDDWNGTAPFATDPAGDPLPSDDPATDILAFFINFHSDGFVFRADSRDFENQQPTANDGADNTLEDTPVTITLTGSDPDGDSLTFAISTAPVNGVLGAVTPVDATSATVEYTPDSDFNGADSFEFTANDGVADSAAASIAINVTAVNDVPVLVLGGDQNVAEDAGAQAVAAFASGSPGGGPDEAGQTVSFNVSNDNNALFSAQPAIDGSGQLSYTPAADTTGSAVVTVSAMDDGGTADGGVDTSADQTFSITIGDVNDPPSFTAGANETVLEDAGAQTVPGWATAISPGPADEAGQTVSFNTSNNNNALFVVQPGIDAAGTLTYTPADDANGAATVTVEAMDDGGTANGGDDTSAPQMFTISVTAVNDAPSFTAGANQSVDENSGAQIVNGWATAISPGPANEAGQTLTFNVTGNTNPALFAAGPAINAAGDLTYTPAADANGAADVTIELMDDGGTANGGVDSSPAQMFTISVSAVNDPPTITTSATPGAPENQTAVIDIESTDDNDAEGAGLIYSLTGGADQGLFSIVAATGVLTFNLPPDFEAPGDANIDNDYEVQVTVTDSGPGGSLTDVQDLAVTVTDVNEPPTAMNESFAVQSNVGIQPGAVSGILANESDPDAGDTVSLTPASVGTFATTAGGSITTLADGSFTYTPQAGNAGVADTFAYTLQDTGGLTDTATATFNVDSNTIWFVDLDAGITGDGTLSDPFDSLADVDDSGANPDADGSTIFHYTSSMGAQTDALADDFDLQASQFLVGEGATGAGTINTLRGFTTHPFSLTLPTIGAALNHSITSAANGGITLAAGNTVRGLDIGNTGAGTGLTGLNFGTLTIDDVSISGTGAILNLDTGTVTDPTPGDFTFGSLDSSANPGIGIDLNAVSGGFTVNASTGSTGGSQGIDIDNASGTFDFGGTTVGGGASSGIDIANSGASSFTFDSLSITASSGPGLSADNGGTVNIAGAGNTISATGGPALDIDATSMGSGWTFNSLSSTNSTGRGIELSNIPASSSLTVTGTTTVDNASAGSLTSDGGIDIASVAAGAMFDFGTTNIINRNGTGIFVDSVISGLVDFGATTIANPNSAAGYGIRVEDSGAAFFFDSTTIGSTVQGTATADATTDGIPDNDGDGDAIFLKNNTGGSFTINGGTLSNLAADGIDLRNSGDLVVRNLAITDIGQTSTSAQSIPDAGVFAYNLTGTNLLRNVTIDNAQTANQSEEHVHVLNDGTSFDELRLSNVDMENTTAGTGLADIRGSNAFSFETRGTVNGTLVVEDGSDATGMRLNAFRFAIGDGSGGSGTVNIVVDQSTMDANFLEVISGGSIQIGVANDIALLVQDNYVVNYTVSNSTLQNSRTGFLSGSFFAGTTVGDLTNAVTPDVTARFHDNVIQDVRGRAGFGLIQELEAGDLSYTAYNNSVQDMQDETIFGANFFVGEAARAVLRADANSNRPEVRYIGNAFGTVIPIAGNGSEEGMFLQPRLNAHTSEFVIESNTIVVNNDVISGSSGEAIEVDVEDAATTHFTLTDNDLTGGNQDEGFTIESEDLASIVFGAAKGNDLNGDELQFDRDEGTMTILDRDTLAADNSNLTVSLVDSPLTTTILPDQPDPKIIPGNGVNTQMTAVNTAYSALAVTVFDAGGNPANGVTVTFTAPGSGASVTFPSGNTAVTNASGVASVPATANATVGAFNVTATATVGGNPADAGIFHLLNTP